MSENPKNISLKQTSTEAAHSAKVMREKIGDVRTLGTPDSQQALTQIVSPDQKPLEEQVIAALQGIFDPEIPVNIWDLGLIYRLAIDAANAVRIEMTLTAPGCPVAGDIVAEVRRKVEAIPEVPKATVELVWEPSWTRDRLSEAARLELGMM